MPRLTHINDEGAAHMVDVSGKAETVRQAIATGRIDMNAQAVSALGEGSARKGDVLAVARIAGIMAAKRTAELIPLCHPLPINKISIDLAIDSEGVIATATIRTQGKTGVEMEAMTAVSVTLLTIYDMAKALDKGMIIRDIHLLEKTGGKSGDWRAD